jgi:outer membrane protein OmpA-like peptidoglycan-associated protein
MIRLSLTIFILTLSSLLLSQTKKPAVESIADCEGAMNIFKSGNYSIQFTGSPGNKLELANYPSLSAVSDQNLIWVTYIADEDGTVSFDASISQDYLQMIIFDEMTSNVCVELSKGIAEIKRIHQQTGQKTVGLNTNISTGILYPIDLLAGQKIIIAFSTVEKSKAIMKLNFKFDAKNKETRALNDTKVIDNRHDEFAPTLSVIVRDAETNEPIIANLTIEGTKELAALYKASEIYFNVSRPTKISIKCDAEGYFFVDKEVSLIATANQDVTLKMERVSKGKSMQIEEIEFKPGTSEFITGSEAKLRRLKDFMALNADINIEIQGHVYASGDNNIGSQKMSEARAKRVMIYLIENGIAKERMSAVGYGNTKPIYPEAKLAYEEQANRRVEILVK